MHDEALSAAHRGVRQSAQGAARMHYLAKMHSCGKGGRASTVHSAPFNNEHRSKMHRKTASVVRKSPALLAGILSATAVPAYAIDPSPAALQIVQSALESSSQQKTDAVGKLDKAISTWKSEKLPDDEFAGLYRLRADARNRFGDSDKAEADLSEVVRLLRGPGAAAADPG